ncbi:zinc finger protein 184-like [Galleria mellonella]|uniref:Zinc finger protein 184-like n=1 Tax=Galleria mellonella TaxID=7137 RepID=A0ABM3N0V1_GALME|nr:zinc finger protein 184-like [Galleria mellonella]
MKIEIREVTTKKVVATRHLTDIVKDKNQQYNFRTKKSNTIGINDNQKGEISTDVKANSNNKVKPKKVVQNNTNKSKEDAVTKQKHYTNIKAILENSNATIIRHRGGIGYACGYCIKQYPDAADLKRHSLETHDDVSLCYFVNNMTLSKYIIKLDITSLRCKLCDTNIKRLEDLMTHLQNTHKVKTFTDIDNHIIPFKFESKNLTCALCENGVPFHKFKSLLEHMTVHYRNYVCEDCDAGFINFEQLRQHRSVHESGSYSCNKCNKVFNNTRKLKAHIRAVHVMKSQPLSKCGYCNQAFLYFHTKEKHLQEVHGVQIARIKCQACDRSFLTRSNYTKHMKLNHLMLRPHACTQCDKAFAYLAQLKEHERRVHMGLRLYNCDECLKTFSTRKALQQHMRIHTNDRRFKCNVCGQAFIAKISWRGHMRSKHGEVV